MQLRRAFGGHRVGRYELLRPLGSGATSVVYEAVDPQQRRVALKLFHGLPEADSVHTARYLREARTAANVQHPNIVRIFDYGEADGAAFLVMELLQGDTLASHLRRTGRLPLHDALAVLLPIASALECLHAAGIVHRDVKPANILLTGGTNQKAKLSDFGLSRLQDDQTSVTRSHDVLGTPAYMAPELILFAAAAASESSDQYALAVTIYECVTGHRPFARASTYATMRSVVAGHIAAPSFVDPSLPEAIDEPLLRAMRSDPSQRFASVREFASALRRAAAAVGLVTRSSSSPFPERIATLPPRASDVVPRSITAPIRRQDCAARRVTVAGLDFVVWLHTRNEPPVDQWAPGVALSTEAVRSGRGIPFTRTFVVSDGGAPNVRQRKELFHDIFAGEPVKTSVITTTGTNPIKKGIATAISWFNPQIRLFHPTDFERALSHIEIPRDAFEPIWASLVSMHESVRTETLPMLARALGLSLDD